MPDYVVTKDAGKEVAGMKSPGEGEKLTLTEQQAEHPLRLGHIERAKREPKPAAEGETAKK